MTSRPEGDPLDWTLRDVLDNMDQWAHFKIDYYGNTWYIDFSAMPAMGDEYEHLYWSISRTSQ